MSEQFNATVNLTTQVCCACGVVFTLPCNMREGLIKNHASFHCPNGHLQCFPGETDEEKEIKHLRSDLELVKQDIDEVIEENEKNKGKLKYWRGKAKKVKK